MAGNDQRNSKNRRSGGDDSRGRPSRSGGRSGPSSSGGRGGSSPRGKGGSSSSRGRGGSSPTRGGGGKPPRPSSGQRKQLHAGGQLPRWVREEINRSTPKNRRDAALRELESGVEAFSAGKFKQAAAALRRAKAASSRAATIRELLGLSAYQIGNWDEALRELRAFRRMSGETDQMPIEMDCLRALGRKADVGKTYALFQELGGGRDTDNEVRVVYGSHLLDEGRIADAFAVVNSKLVANPPESLVRRWAVAAKVAHAAGDQEATSKFLAAIRDHDPEISWLEDLERELDI